jgi:ParB-like chromosome segregation protein Spo0J
MRNSLPVDGITVPERTRKDMGDVAQLARSIDELGLLEPIGVTTAGELVFGARRLEAVKSLKWKEVPVVLIDLTNPLAAERDENTQRKDFTPSELVAMGRRIEARERGLARLRGTSNLRNSSVAPSGAPGESSVKASDAVGMSKNTYGRAKVVVQAAEQHPELQPIADAMDAGLPVMTAYNRVKEELDDMNQAATNGSARSAQKRERPPIGMQKRTGLTARLRLERISDTLAGYADALPEMHTRGEDVGDVLDAITENANRVKSAVRQLKKGLVNAQ